MWSNLNTTTSYEGGFLDTSQRGEAGGDDRKTKRPQNIVPVAIKYLTKVRSVDSIKLYNKPVPIVQLVGIVRHIDESATKISYQIEDQTGTITAMKWLEADRKTRVAIMEANTYVKVCGVLREQSDKRYILILRILPLSSINELTTHLLQLTHAPLLADQNAKEGPGKGKETAAANTKTDTDDDAPFYGMTADQTLVYKIINAEKDSEAGAERSQIKARVPKRILASTDQILDFLVSEGHVYTTSTDDHFKST